MNYEGKQQVKKQHEFLTYYEMAPEFEHFLQAGSWEYDLSSNKMQWSDGLYRLYGYTMEESIRPEPNDALFLIHFTAEELRKTKIIWTELLTQEVQSMWQFEIITLGGEKKILESFGKVVCDANGKRIKVIGNSKDITKFQECNNNLQLKIDELEKSRKELEEFAYIASHDLQEPLRKITTFGERLEQKSADNLGDEALVYLRRMLVATENMKNLIDDLLEFSRTTRSKLPFVKTDLNLVLRSVTVDLELKIGETKAIVHAKTLPVIEMIDTQAKQLFSNLIGNAIKFRKQDANPVINITCERTSQKEVQALRLDVQKKYFTITVEDNGIGFDQQYSERIFQLFQRLYGKAEYPGSGIGLSICKKIVEYHKGTIYTVSAPLQGASFYIVLPEIQTNL